MSDKKNYLPKGHEVLYIVTPESEDMWRQFRNLFRNKDITWTEDDIHIFIKGFIAGDSEKGISLVALDNPTACLIESYMPETREQLRLGWIRRLKQLGYEGAVCPYS